jgi:hypothetical protein
LELLAEAKIKRGGFKVGSSGCFDHAAQSDARRAHAHVLGHAGHHRAHTLQIRIPPAPPRIIRVAHDIPVLRPFAAQFTLHCHNCSRSISILVLFCPDFLAISAAKPSSSFYQTRPPQQSAPFLAKPLPDPERIEGGCIPSTTSQRLLSPIERYQ